ncbi:MAG: hypothetical protein NC217_01930 [Muribaculaceae bacterium]|nr:hypothetical protein [Muribaculaceae bacterium]
MKLIFSFIVALMCCVSLAHATQTPSTSDQVLVREGFVLNDKGVDIIVLGMKVSDIPDHISGLYDHFEKVETPDAEEYQFFMNDSAIFAAGDFGDGIISYISLFNESPIRIATSSGSDYIEL